MAIHAARRIRSDDVMHTLTGLFTSNGVPEHIRSDNGPEFTAKAVRDWLPRVGVQTSVHSARESVGERLQREFQREAQGRTAKWRDLLFAQGSANTDRTVEEGVQHNPSSQLTGVPAAST